MEYEIAGFLIEPEDIIVRKSLETKPTLPKEIPHPSTKRISILFVTNCVRDFSCNEMYELFSHFGQIIRITSTIFVGDQRYAIYYDQEHDASKAMIVLAGMTLAGQSFRFLGIVRSIATENLHEQVHVKLQGIPLETVEYSAN